MRKKAVFITAVGTDAGKTYISALIVKKLIQSGINAGYYKPALSGADRDRDGGLIAGDAAYVCREAGIEGVSPNGLTSYIYETPSSPHLAASIEGNPATLKKIHADFCRAAELFDFVVVEGCGGIICPISVRGERLKPGGDGKDEDDTDIMLTDIIKTLGLGIFVVAPSGLGAINSAVLTAEYAKQKDIAVRGIILNGFKPGDFIHEDNAKQIERLGGVDIIAKIESGCKDFPLSADGILAAV
jgi:dethiobiotin synthetase